MSWANNAWKPKKPEENKAKTEIKPLADIKIEEQPAKKIEEQIKEPILPTNTPEVKPTVDDINLGDLQINKVKKKEDELKPPKLQITATDIRLNKKGEPRKGINASRESYNSYMRSYLKKRRQNNKTNPTIKKPAKKLNRKV